MFTQQLSIPRRLHYSRIIVTLAMIFSVFLSFRLWGGENFFPDKILAPSLHTLSPYGYALAAMSILSLVFSLVHSRYRLFIFFSLTLNVTLVLLDQNRLQPWFYLYNAILFILMLYDGRVDNPSKFTSIFICIQFIVASIYISNGISWLKSGYDQNDLSEVIRSLVSSASERQMKLLMILAKAIPWLIALTGFGLLFKPSRFIFIFAALAFHLGLLVLLFPSSQNTDNALWLMNPVMFLLVAMLFYGQTEQRYFSPLIMIQKPLFYLVIFTFWIYPIAVEYGLFSHTPAMRLMYGKSPGEVVVLKQNEYHSLPLYLKHFCQKSGNGYELKLDEWCRHELRSENMAHGPLKCIYQHLDNNVAKSVVKDSEDELSSL